jgi:RNA polymerase sigma-70 factor (ECF subfamily)
MRRRQLVQVALQRLNARQREVLVLSDLEGRSAPEVAEMTGVPVGTVYSRLHHARKAFAKALHAVGQEPSGSLKRNSLGRVLGA